MSDANATKEQAVKQNVLDMFIGGARIGLKIATNNMLPNVIMAFVLIKALNVTGILKMLGTIFAPVMALWGLPGESIAVLVSAFMSMGGGIGTVAGLYANGSLSKLDITILMPAIYLIGSLIQYLGRCLGTAEVNTKYWIPILIMCFVNALLAMWVMRLLMSIF